MQRQTFVIGPYVANKEHNLWQGSSEGISAMAEMLYQCYGMP